MSDPLRRSRDLQFLHPLVRAKVRAVQGQLDREGIPLKVFEAFRYPQRQHELYQQGRIDRCPKVTYKDAWGSYHQYGLAVDFVLYENGQWDWDDNGPKAHWWKRMQEIGRENGLEPLNFETPHLQLAGTSSTHLYRGEYPADGDLVWAENLRDAITNWHGSSAAPPIPPLMPARPDANEIEDGPIPLRAMRVRLAEPAADALDSPLLCVDTMLVGIVAGSIPPLRPSQVRNAAVGVIQDALSQIGGADPQSGINLELDPAQRGYFGPKTSAAVRRFQIVKGLEPDMLVGKNTLLALDRALIGIPPSLAQT